MSLHSCAHEGNKEGLEALIKKESSDSGGSREESNNNNTNNNKNEINKRDSEGNSALHYAAAEGHVDCVLLLLRAGADPNLPNSKFGVIPLQEALRNGNQQCAKKLIEGGSQVTWKDNASWSVLHYAVLHDNNLELIQTLINMGAEINTQNNSFQTSLHVACSRGATQFISYLLLRGAKMDIRDIDHKTPFSFLSLTPQQPIEVPATLDANNELSRSFKQLVNNESMSDIRFELTADGSLIYAHQCIISSRCPKLLEPSIQVTDQQLIPSDKLPTNCVKIGDILKPVMIAILQWCYSATVDEFLRLDTMNSLTFLTDLLGASDKFEIKSLGALCESIVTNLLYTQSVDISQELKTILHLIKTRPVAVNESFKRFCIYYLVKNFHLLDPNYTKQQISNADYLKYMEQLSIEKSDEFSLKPSSSIQFIDASRTLSGKNLRLCKGILRTLTKDKEAWPFLQPVDPKALNIPDYFSVIKQPMDLGTIRTNLENNQYFSVLEWISDVRLVFENALTYNEAGSPVYRMAEYLKTGFEQKLASSSFEKPPKSNSTNKPSSHPIGGKSLPLSSNLNSISTNSTEPTSNKKRKVDQMSSESSVISTPISAPSHSSIKNFSFQTNSGHMAAKSVSESEMNGSTPKKDTIVKLSVKTNATYSPIPKVIPMTFTEKKRLGELMNQLSSEQLIKAIEIISESKKPQLQNEEEDTIDIDMNDVDDTTLRKLEIFLNSCIVENEPFKKENVDEEDINILDEEDKDLDSEKNGKKLRQTNVQT